MPKNEGYLKKERITTKKEYQDIFNRGKKINGSWMKIHYTNEENDRKIGIIISRRIKGSVKRNRYKRLLREAYRKNKSEIKETFKIVAVVFRDIPNDSYTYVASQLMELVQRAQRNEKINHSHLGDI